MKKKEKIGQILVRSNLLSEEELENALFQAKVLEMRLGEAVCQLGYITEQELIRVLSTHTGIPIVELSNIEIKKDILDIIPLNFCKKNKIIPYKILDGRLFVAIVDPLDIKTFDDIKLMLDCDVIPSICAPTEFEAIMGKLIVETKPEDSKKGDGFKAITLKEKADVFFEKIFSDAIEKNVSTVHFESMPENVAVRFRVNSVLCDTSFTVKDAYPFILEKIKFNNNFKIKGKDVVLKFKTIPTALGQDAVVDIQAPQIDLKDLKRLGMQGAIYEQFRNCLLKGSGVIFFTGHTKDVLVQSVRACACEIDVKRKKTYFIEEEYKLQIPNVRHVVANEKNKYKDAIINVFTCDADVILIDELKDRELVKSILEMSLKDCLFVTSVANFDIVAWLDKIGYEGLNCVVSQRMVNALCQNCKTKRHLNSEEKKQLERLGILFNTDIVFEPQGCPDCHNTGFEGNIGVFGIIEGKDCGNINYVFKDDAVAKWRAGIIGYEELYRVMN